MLAQSSMPGSDMIPAGCAFRALLALKLWGIKRPYHVMPDILDAGAALFAGLNAMPKRATLSEYSCRVDPRQLPGLMDHWHAAINRRQRRPGGGRCFDVDFHTIPHHGDDALMQKHDLSRRSRRQRGVLAFLARDAQARTFAWANAGIGKPDQRHEVLRFVEAWRARTKAAPEQLVFDSQLTSYANLAELDRMGIAFITLRRRTRKMIAELFARPAEQWQRVTLSNVGRQFRNPCILDQTTRIRHYPGDIRQIAAIGLGHDKPALLLTNQMHRPARQLIDRYARRMIIENTIADAVDFFHMDALSAVVPMKIDLDLQLTVMASNLYRLFAQTIGQGLETAKPRTIFRKLVNAAADIEIGESDITVILGRRAHNPYLINAGYLEQATKIPWLGNRILRIHQA